MADLADHDAIQAWATEASARRWSNSNLSPSSWDPFNAPESRSNSPLLTKNTAYRPRAARSSTPDLPITGRRSRRNSTGSRRSQGSVSGASSNSKSADEELSESAFVSAKRHWNAGASVLNSLGTPFGGFTPLLSTSALVGITMRLSRALKDVKTNAKAWNTIKSTLSRHFRELAKAITGLDKIPNPDQPILIYGEVLRLILATWICTVDPRIQIPYDDLPNFQKGPWTNERFNLCGFVGSYQEIRLDEDFVHELGKREEEAFHELLTACGGGKGKADSQLEIDPAELPREVASAANQNPPNNTLYVGNLPTKPMSSQGAKPLENALIQLFSKVPGYRELYFRQKSHGPVCFVQFDDVCNASKAMIKLYGNTLNGLVKGGGIRLSYSKNPLGRRASEPE